MVAIFSDGLKFFIKKKSRMRLSYTKNGKHHLIMDKLEGYQKACKLQDNDLKKININI
jgi:hypothetical protein